MLNGVTVFDLCVVASVEWVQVRSAFCAIGTSYMHWQRVRTLSGDIVESSDCEILGFGSRRVTDSQSPGRTPIPPSKIRCKGASRRKSF